MPTVMSSQASVGCCLCTYITKVLKQTLLCRASKSHECLWKHYPWKQQECFTSLLEGNKTCITVLWIDTFTLLLWIAFNVALLGIKSFFKKICNIMFHSYVHFELCTCFTFHMPSWAESSALISGTAWIPPKGNWSPRQK